MAKPDLGTKRQCQNCGTKFFDLSKDPILCPKCGTVFQVVAVSSRAAARATPVDDEEAEPEPDAEVVSLEDADQVDDGKVVAAATDDDVDTDEDDPVADDDDDTFLEEEEEDDGDVADLIDGDIEDDEER